MVSLYIAMFSCDVDCALTILQLNSPIHTVSFGSAITFPQNQNNQYCVQGVIFVSKSTPYVDYALLCLTSHLHTILQGRAGMGDQIIIQRREVGWGKVLSHTLLAFPHGPEDQDLSNGFI
jgi:hypothetical protein